MENIHDPIIQYQQKDCDRTCMVYAMASAMHYSGDSKSGAWMRNRVKRYVYDRQSFRTFVRDIHQQVKVLKTSSNVGKSFDIIGDDLLGLYLVQVQGSDGKEDHCVAVTNQWIFDSNFKNVLPRCKASMNMCCSSENEKSLFVKCVNVEHFPKVICD